MKKQKLQFGPIILLLIYALSIAPSFVFHHHEHTIVSHDAASPCEKSIYYGDDINDCGHETHVSETIDKCKLCEHQSSLLFSFGIKSFRLFSQFISIEFDEFYRSLTSHFFSLLLNKGPPTV